jgi:hypothetical protein
MQLEMRIKVQEEESKVLISKNQELQQELETMKVIIAYMSTAL